MITSVCGSSCILSVSYVMIIFYFVSDFADMENGYEKPGEATIEYTTSSFQVHDFIETFCDTCIAFTVLKMKDSVFIWLGLKNEPTLTDMSLAIQTLYSALPSSIKILGKTSDVTSTNIAIRLQRKLQKPVYVSCNVPLDRFLLPAVEKRLAEELKNKPECF